MRLTFGTMQCNSCSISRPGQSNVLRFVIEIKSYKSLPLRKSLKQVIIRLVLEKKIAFVIMVKKGLRVGELARFELLNFVTPIHYSIATLRKQPCRHIHVMHIPPVQNTMKTVLS